MRVCWEKFNTLTQRPKANKNKCTSEVRWLSFHLPASSVVFQPHTRFLPVPFFEFVLNSCARAVSLCRPSVRLVTYEWQETLMQEQVISGLD
jgi:hypothetical protein